MMVDGLKLVDRYTDLVELAPTLPDHLMMVDGLKHALILLSGLWLAGYGFQTI